MYICACKGRMKSQILFLNFSRIQIVLTKCKWHAQDPKLAWLQCSLDENAKQMYALWNIKAQSVVNVVLEEKRVRISNVIDPEVLQQMENWLSTNRFPFSWMLLRWWALGLGVNDCSLILSNWAIQLQTLQNSIWVSAQVIIIKLHCQFYTSWLDLHTSLDSLDASISSPVPRRIGLNRSGVSCLCLSSCLIPELLIEGSIGVAWGRCKFFRTNQFVILLHIG